MDGVSNTPAMSDLLPVPVIVALLRLTRGRPLAPGDEDILFDEFGRLGEDSVLHEAIRRVLGRVQPIMLERRELGRAQLDAACVDMLREHHALRIEQRERLAA